MATCRLCLQQTEMILIHTLSVTFWWDEYAQKAFWWGKPWASLKPSAYNMIEIQK